MNHYEAVAAQLPMAARPFPALADMEAHTWGGGGGLAVLELNPNPAAPWPVLWYDNEFNATPQACVYYTGNELRNGNPAETWTFPAGLNVDSTAALLAAIADHAFRQSEI